MPLKSRKPKPSFQDKAVLEKSRTGIDGFDEITGGGLPKGRPTIICGGPGCGKTLFASEFIVRGAIEFNEPGVFVSFEETESELTKNVASLGFDLATNEVKLMLSRLIDYLKNKGITAILTGLRYANDNSGDNDTGISSLIDTWISLNSVHSGGECNRTISVVKSRGMDHSNQVREFLLSKNGTNFVDIYLGAAGVLTGSMRLAQEAKDLAEAQARSQEVSHLTAQLEGKRKFYAAQTASIGAELKASEAELLKALSQSKLKEERARLDRIDMEASRRKKHSATSSRQLRASKNAVVKTP